MPPSAENVVRFWRDYIEERAGNDIRELANRLTDQKAFADKSRDIIRDMGLEAELEDPAANEDNAQDSETVDDNSDADSELLPQDVVLDDDQMGEESADGESTAVEMDADMDSAELGAEADQDEAPQMMPDDAGMITMDHNYEAFTHQYDEVISADELCDSEELVRLRALLDQQLVSLQHATSKLANRLQRRLMAKQNRTWEFDLEEGALDASRLAQVIIDPMLSLIHI